MTINPQTNRDFLAEFEALVRKYTDTGHQVMVVPVVEEWLKLAMASKGIVLEKAITEVRFVVVSPDTPAPHPDPPPTPSAS